MKKETLSYPLVFAENYYISQNGYVFYISKDIKLLPFIENNDIVVTIKSKKYSLFNLMLEYFISSKTICKYEYYVEKKRPLSIPLRCIKKATINKLLKVGDSDYFNCESKARTANSRGKGVLTKQDVSFVIMRENYKCAYCAKKLIKTNWHLDHIKPISKKGTNDLDNLTASCSTCNLMKNSMILEDFISKCGTIYKLKKLQDGRK